MLDQMQILEIEQGCQEWYDLRKTKITATDATIIMGVSHWKTKVQLYREKISQENNNFVNDAMRRGVELEPIARELFILQTGIEVKSAVVIRDWTMASLDGISDCGNYIVEIKCAGEKDHQTALKGKVPDHYYPQIQHQLYVCNLPFAYYFSFDGIDGVIVECPRDDKYIEKMLVEEKTFYDCLINKTPPEPDENDYVEREDEQWKKCASNWIAINSQIKQLEQIQEDLRKDLIFLAGESNTKGAGISLCQVNRKGNIDYSKIPELKGIDLEKYRKSSINSWRITV